MKKLFLLSACLWLLASPVQAQGGSPDIVVVRVRDYVTSAALLITRGEGKTEKVEVDVKGLSFDKRMAAISEGYYKMIAKLYQEGYVLQNSSAISGQDGSGTLTYLFVKGH